MSYQNIYVKRTKSGNEVHLWDERTGYSKFQYKPYAYLKSQTGTYRSLYGDKLKKVRFWTGEDLQKGNVFESDVPIETRVLVDMYTDSEEMSSGHREVYFDIEVEVTGGFPEPSKAHNKITSIALYDKVVDNYFVFVISDKKHNSSHDKTVVETFESEEELLQRFYQKYIEIQPTILSGWNIDGFDIPYLYNRTRRVLGDSFANSLSPIGDIFYLEHKNRYKIAGVSCLDYLKLYRLFTYTQQSSYRLDFIGQLEVGIGKVEYEGTLNDLYETDINKFIEYNLNDVKIVKALDDKLKFIDLARGIAHVGHVPYEDVYFSSRYLEGAILTYLKGNDIVAPNKKLDASDRMDKDGRKFSGAYVKDPKPGRYDWVFDLDLTSMYPSIIMSLNISPEMKIGKLVGWDSEEFIKGTKKTYSLENDGKIQGRLNEVELKELFGRKKISVSSNGVLYRNDKKGLMPTLLLKWFDERVEYKRLMKKHGDEGDMEKSGYFKRRQHIQKIVLNSLYGVLGLPVFRFYDIDNAEATTVTGQELIKFTEKMADYYYNKELKTDDNHVIYVDTDSIFCSAVPLIKHRNSDADLNDDEYMTKEILLVTSEVQDFLNKSYDVFAKRFLNCDTHRFDIKQEVISKSAFWVTKKRYGQWIINDGGFQCDKLDVKGFDIVRSNFPVAFRKLMSDVLKGILDHTPKDDIDDMIFTFKKSLKNQSLDDISLPTGVKGIQKFADRSRGKFKDATIFTKVKKGTPVHVKATIIYNDLLKYHNLKETEPIRNSDKIKWVYLKENPLNIKQLAFKGYNDPQEIMEYIKKYIDRDKLFNKALQKKIDMFYESMNWVLIDKQNTLERFF